MRGSGPERCLSEVSGPASTTCSSTSRANPGSRRSCSCTAAARAVGCGAPHLDALGDRFHCLAPDLPGFGRSNHLAPVSLDEAAGLVAEFVEARVPDGRATLVGLSYGGSLVLSLMGDHASVLERAVVDGAAVLTWWGDRLVIAGVAAVSPVIRTRAVRAVLGRLDMSGLGEELRSTTPAAFRRAFADGWVAPLSRPLLAAPCPTLLVGGGTEKTVRASNAALAELLPNAEARFAPGHGHAWFAWELDLHIRMVEAWAHGRGAAVGAGGGAVVGGGGGAGARAARPAGLTGCRPAVPSQVRQRRAYQKVRPLMHQTDPD